jgi:hypothetical protein
VPFESQVAYQLSSENITEKEAYGREERLTFKSVIGPPP